MKKNFIFLITAAFLIIFLSCTDPTDPGTEPDVSYTVSFESNGGSAIADQSVITGGFVTAPSAPTKSGFGLSGWFTDTTLTAQWNFASDTVASDMTLYAGWNDLFIDSFSTDGFVVWNSAADGQDIGYDIALDSDGNVYVTGYSTEGVSSTTENDMTIWKFNRSGILDTGFSGDGTVFFDGGHDIAYPNGDTGWGIALDPNGSIYTAGDSFLGNLYSCAWKYDSAGNTDNEFSDDGWAVQSPGDENYTYDIAITGNGIYITGSSWNYNGDDAYIRDMFILRYTESGSPDTTGFGAVGIAEHNVSGTGSGSSTDEGYAIAVAGDGSIYVAGYTYLSENDMVLWKFDAGGVLDTGFNGSGFIIHDEAGGRDSKAKDLAIGADGSIYVTGYINNGSNDDMAVWKYSSSGSLITGFGTGGIVISHGAAGGTGNDYGEGIVINDDGYIYVSGSSWNGEASPSLDMTIWKFDSAGTPVSSFGADGVVSHNGASSGTDNPDEGFGIALDTAGNIYICGQSSAAGIMDMAVWKYNPNGALMGE